MLISTISYSQNEVQISGQVRDEYSKEVLNYCSVVVLNPKDSIITGAVTDESGFFYIPVIPGSYKLVLSFMGYKNDTINTGFIRSDKFLGTFHLSPDSKMMNGVEVTSSSRESTIDKDIQIVTKEMRIGTSDAKDLLAKVSGVSYDRYNNSIKVDNSSQIVILADGVEKNTEYIQNLAPERIKRIEIIRDPGGRYGLEGYTAIVNVILNKNYVGSEIFVSDQMLVDVDPIKDGYYLAMNRFSASYNYTYNKINLYGSISNNMNDFAVSGDTKTTYDNDSIVYQKPINSDANTLINNKSTNYTVGMDYYINPKHTISFESDLNNFPKSSNKFQQEFNTSVVKSGVEIDSYNFNLASDSKWIESNNSLFYNGKLTNKDKLESSFTFSTHDDDYTKILNQDPSIKRVETGNNNTKSTNLNIEYSREFNEKLNTQIGYSNHWKKTDNYYIVEGNNPKETYSQTNTRNKFYGYASYTFTKKLSSKIGIAGETSHIVDDNQDNNYLIWQPLLDIKYKFSDKFSVKLKYRSRSYYPTMDETNPFERYLDPRTVSVGNPDLTPSLTHKISLRAEAMHGVIALEPYYHVSNDYIAQIGHLRNDGIFEYTYENIGRFEEKGIKANFTIPFGKKTFWQNSFTYYNSSITNNGKTNSVSDWRANSQFIHVMENEGVFVLNYERSMSKNITSLGYNRNNNDYWLFLYQQPFLKKRLSIMVGYFLPINLGANYIQDEYTKTDEYEQYTNTDISVLKNMFIVRATFRFSKGKIKKTAKDIEKEEGSKKGGFL